MPPSIQQFRQDREKSLADKDGWLSLIALVPLKEGRNGFGSAKDNAIVLPERAPAYAGRFEREMDVVTVFLEAPGAINGRKLRSGVITAHDKVRVGDFTLNIHPMEDGPRIRVRDAQAQALKKRRPLRWFPVDPKYAVRGTFEPYDRPKIVQVDRIGGGTLPYEVPGVIKAAIDGQTVELEPFNAGPGAFWLIFKDLTSGRETYGAARFLDGIKLEADGSVLLDFNYAINPPCAYNPYTTCPLPPPKNRLKAAIRAGEKNYH